MWRVLKLQKWLDKNKESEGDKEPHKQMAGHICRNTEAVILENISCRVTERGAEKPCRSEHSWWLWKSPSSSSLSSVCLRVCVSVWVFAPQTRLNWWLIKYVFTWRLIKERMETERSEEGAVREEEKVRGERKQPTDELKKTSKINQTVSYFSS